MSKGKAIQLESETSIGNLRKGTVQFVVQEGIQLDSLQEILKRVVNLHGCTVCGLAGIDLRFRVRENLIFEKFADIEGIYDVIIQR